MALTDHIKDRRSPFLKVLGDAAVPHRVVGDFEGAGGRFKGVSIAVRALPGDALLRAEAAALRACETLGFKAEELFTEGGESALQFETKVQTLARAIVDPDAPSTPFFASAEEARLLEPDEVHVLYNHFLAWQEERSPISRAGSWEKLEASLVALGKGTIPRSWLSSFDASSLRHMLCELATQYATRTSHSSSPTSPSPDSPPSSDESSG